MNDAVPEVPGPTVAGAQARVPEVDALRPALSRVIRRAWALVLGLAGVVCLTVLLLPVDSAAWVAVLRGTSILAMAVFLWAVLRMPAHARGVWWGLWVFQVLTVAGDVVYDVLMYHFGEEPFPSVADVLYLASYVAVIGALVLLVHRRQPGQDRDTWIDTAILAVAVASVIATVVILPTLADATAPTLATLISLAYPLLDLVVLSVLIRLLVGVDRLNLALALLALSVVLTLTADVIYNGLAAQAIEEESSGWVEVLYLAAILMLTAAATAPGARSIAKPRRRTRPGTKARLVSLAMGALTAPTLLAFAVWDEAGLAARLLAVASITVILLVLWRSLGLMATVQEQASQLADMARTDGLTGLPNRRTWDHQLSRVAGGTAAKGIPLTVAILDLDRFKDYNDIHGHPGGDRLLIACARAWSSQLDPPAFLARYGGEEFAVLLPGTPLAEAQHVLDRLRVATPDQQTVSIGCAQKDPTESAIETLDRADRALYAAKSAGRDRVLADTT